MDSSLRVGGPKGVDGMETAGRSHSPRFNPQSQKVWLSSELKFSAASHVKGVLSAESTIPFRNESPNLFSQNHLGHGCISQILISIQNKLFIKKKYQLIYTSFDSPTLKSFVLYYLNWALVSTFCQHVVEL